MAASFCSRASDASATCRARSRGTTTTPSSSATITSPGRITWPSTAIGTLTEPPVALTVPWADTARDQAAKPMSRSSWVSRMPALMTMPRTPRRWSAVANSSPNRPSVHGEVVVTTRTSPSPHCSTAAWIIRLSPGQLSTVTAVPATRTPCWTGRIPGPSSPVRPMASLTVATP